MTVYRNTMNILVTGTAGFIGFHASHRLLKDGHDVVGVDNLNDYYDTNLKRDRLAHLMKFPNFTFQKREAEVGFNENDRVREPASLYAATKISGEMLSESYAKLYDIPLTGLRFFTVYGPWGRPDMAYWIFTEKILKDEPITLFAPDIMRRDFTFVDDIVSILPRLLASKPDQHKIYNLGNSAPNSLYDLVSSVETACERKAKTIIKPQQPGDVQSTFADIRSAHDTFGFSPSVQLTDGITEFVDWYKHWTNAN